MDKIKVLIVENSSSILNIVSHFFQMHDCEICPVEDGLQAMIAAQSFCPDILFTDIIMPIIGGDELCRIIRKDHNFKNIFIVIFSDIAYEDEENILGLDADLCIAKGPDKTIGDHISHVLDAYRSGKRRENILHGKEALNPRAVIKKLLVSRRHYHAVMDNIGEAVVELNEAGLIVAANKVARELLHRDPAILFSSRLTSYLAGPESQLVDRWLASASMAEQSQFCSSYETPLLIGSREVILKLVITRENDNFFVIAILQDITQRKHIEGELVKTVNEFNAVMESIEYGILFMDSDLKVQIANRAFRDMWRIPDEYISCHPTFRDIINFNRHNNIYNINEEQFDNYLDTREATVRSGIDNIEEVQRKDGVVYQYQCVILPDGSRMLTYFDITRHKNTASQLSKALDEVQKMANHDPLTGLPNIRSLEERASVTFSISQRNNWKTAVMFIDLDGFKAVNDNYGHMIGDIVIKMAAQRLLKIVRRSDVVSRIGGDEFVVMQTEIYDDCAIDNVANKILNQMTVPFDIAGNQIQIGASIGISIYPTHGTDIQILIKKSDDAMYKAKKLGKNRYIFTNGYF